MQQKHGTEAKKTAKKKEYIAEEIKIIALDSNFEQMLISAERYACGRRTYIVQDTVTYILGLLPFLSDWCIGVMQEDLKGKFIMYERSDGWFSLGDDCDRVKWELLRDRLNEEMNNRKEKNADRTVKS